MSCYDQGWLRRTSVVVNGAGWAHAVHALRRRPGLAVSLHVNLFEGCPVSPPEDVDLLVDRGGQFHRGFVWLWARGSAGSRATRVRTQIRLELRRQIDRFREAFGPRPLSIDGHVHYHVLPAVWNELMALSAECPIHTIRLPREPLYWPLTRGAPRPPVVNVVKNVVLRVLCRRLAPALRDRGISTSAAFVGVLGSGAMTLKHVRAALEHLRRTGAAGIVEILFHPGGGCAEEAALWRDRPELQAFYLSADRQRERDLLRSDALGEVLREYGVIGEAAAARDRPAEVRQ